jgi:hypothetical protein
MKKYLFLIVPALMLFSCQNGGGEGDNLEAADSTLTEVAENPLVDVNIFDSVAADYVDQTITIEGTCVHTCKHGGGKMHIVGDNPDNRVVIMATDESGKFNADMEGIKYKVIAKVLETRIDSAYLAQWESEVLAGDTEGGDGIKHKHGGEGDNADADEAAELEMKLAHIDEARIEVAETEKGYLSNFSLDCISYEEIK